MARHWTVVCYSWVAMQIAIAASVSLAQTRPSTQPTDTIVDVVLEDPINPDSRCYLDLDTGKTYPRGETQADLIASRQFIHEHGIDLMCETREPSRGLVAYDMILRANTIDIGRPPEFYTLRRMFEKEEFTPFDFVTPGDELPKSYLFRTSGGSMGVLRVVAVTQNPTGLRLRYRLIPEPPPPPLPPRRMVGSVLRLGPTIAAQAEAQAAQQEQDLALMRQRYGEGHPNVKRAERTLKLDRDLVDVAKTETDPHLLILEMTKLREQAQLDELQEVLPSTAPAVKKVMRELEVVNIQIQDIESRRQKTRNNGQPTTLPTVTDPTTRPFAEDFHL